MTAGSTGINTADLVAIDMHVHTDMQEDFREAAHKHFGATHEPLSVESMAARYRERNMAAVVLTVDHQSVTGHPPISNREIARQAAGHADVLIPFASIDPASGAERVREARILVEEFGVKGFKFHPNLQGISRMTPWPTHPMRPLRNSVCPPFSMRGGGGVVRGCPVRAGFG